MPASTTEQTADPGLISHLSGLVGFFSGYLRARLELAGIEAKEAAIHYAIILGLLIAALGAIAFGYVFFCIALVFALAALFHSPHTWIWITFGLALLHLGAAVTAVLIAKMRISAPMFAATLEEFKKDQEWLTKTAKKS